ncbi:hypothetical protein [Demequina sediminis]|uniref:hypothetical protein n=1 Tax=Demequina sediminis TaxID=1930058 RepID=UPI002574550F|nr:hypothetical protein [Demequina sediminis]
MGRLQLTAVLTLVTAIVVGTLLTACAPRPYGPESSLDLGVPGDVVDTVTDVQFYPACGNEPVTVDGVTWYPFVPANLLEFPEVAALATPAGEGGMGGGRCVRRFRPWRRFPPWQRRDRATTPARSPSTKAASRSGSPTAEPSRRG